MKKFFFFSIATITAISIKANPVSPDEALSRIQGNAPSYIAGKTTGKFKLMHTEQSGTINAVYLFSHDNGEGFILTPADDCAPAILGYGDSKVMNEKGEMAPGFKYWMGELARQIEYSVNNPIENKILRVNRPNRNPINTLCTTLWNQSAPYNDECPQTSAGEKCVTGCVATAMSQVMKYHNWPEVGEGEVSIKWQGRNVKMNLARTKFDWANMLDTYNSNSTDDQRKAVATLMKAAGLSVGMNYSPSASGASSTDIAPALGRNFKYDKSLRYLQRDFYSLVEWEDLIYNSLVNDGPVIYDGQATIGGHSFVCDGYQGDGYFHFNWGWGGMSDGYFLLDALDPVHQGIGGADSGFDFMQDVIVGIRPDKTGDSKWSYQMYGKGSPIFTIEEDEEDGEKYLLLNAPFYNYGPGVMTDASVGLKFTSVDDSSKEPSVFLYTVDGAIQVYYGFSGLAMNLPELENGRYYITPVFKCGDDELREVLYPIYDEAKTIYTVNGNDVSVNSERVEYPDFDYTYFAIKIKQTDPVRVKGNLTNPNDVPYMCFFSEMLLDQSQSSIVAYSAPRVYDLDPNETIEVDLTANMQNLDKLPDGEYYFCVGELFMSTGVATILTEPTKIYVGKNSGIEDILPETMQGVKEYYTLDGVKIATVRSGESTPELPAGIYIIKSCKETVKVILR